MEILVSIIISSVVEVIKEVSKMIGKELTKKITVIIVMVGCAIGAYLFSNEIITQEMITNFVQLALMAVGWYEIIYKRVIQPAFNSVFGA